MVLKKDIPKTKTIEEYILSSPAQSQQKLFQLLQCLRKAAPAAKEELKWGMPALSYKRILVTFAIFKKHIGFYPTPSVVKAFEKELKEFSTAKSSIQFPLDKPLPLALIRKLTLYRVRESVEKDGRWK